jgi:hypothetical protein
MKSAYSRGVACKLSMLRTDVCPTRTAQYCRIFQIGYVSAAMGLNQLAPYLGYGAVGGQSIINTCRIYRSYRKTRPQLKMLLSTQPGAT